MSESDEIKRILGSAKTLAVEYYKLTNKPLGITGEIAEYEAARLLGLELCPARTEGYDALWPQKEDIKVQIKGRCLQQDSKRGQRVGSIKLKKAWDIVVLVLLDEDLNATAIYQAGRPEITIALKEPGSKSRNERGALSIEKFKSIGFQIWPPEREEKP